MPRRHKAAKSACVRCGALELALLYHQGALEEIRKTLTGMQGGAVARALKVCNRHLGTVAKPEGAPCP